jgi:hypothetical protein
MADPIELPASGSEDALVDAIAAATAGDAPLHLGPGVHLTKPGRRNLIPIGAHGLSIAAQPSAQGPVTIRRPDDSIDLAEPDWNFGLFFVPERPTPDEEAQLTWRPGSDAEGPIEFDVIIRGRITIDGLRVDCNMDNQGLAPSPPAPNVAEHSTMLGFRGRAFTLSGPGEVPRRIAYVGFESVELTDLVIENGGFSGDVWISRGGFYPNIVDFVVDGVTSTPRVNQKRAALDFSGLCRTVAITRSRIASIGLEHTTAITYDRLPRVEPDFVPSAWRIVDVATDGVDMGASGFVYEIEATHLTTRRFYYVDRASGTVSDSSLVVDTRRRMNRLPGFEFHRVLWTLPPDAGGHVKGLRPTSLLGQPCRVAFIDNTFRAPGAATGEILDSRYSARPANSVDVTALGCTYPDDFGVDPARPIARVNERGVWRFAQVDLGTLDPDVALPTHPEPDVHRLIV